jgi:catechol 2,3-dioxygenase-like lactoylglutathione lyase family enzyme
MDHVFAGIPVADLDAGLDWWERLLGRAPDMYPNDSEACWQLTETSWIYVVRDAERAGNGLLTVLVGDLERELAGIAERGIEVGEVTEIPGVIRTELADPDGNRVQFGQPLSQ